MADGDIIDKIVDAAGQKGTGRWTSLEALKLGVNISMITAACNTRVSSNDTGRKTAQEVIAAPSVAAVDKEKFAEDLRTALYTAKIMAYAQGFSLYRKASEEYGWDLNYGLLPLFSEPVALFRPYSSIRLRKPMKKSVYGKSGL